MDSEKIQYVARVVVKDENTDAVLLLKRPQKTSYFPEHWEFPGGKVELHASVFESAVRELFEETGITLDQNQLLILEVLSNEVENATSKYFGWVFINIFFLVYVPQQEISISDEHTDSEWSYKNQDTLCLTPETKLILEKITRS